MEVPHEVPGLISYSNVEFLSWLFVVPHCDLEPWVRTLVVTLG